MMEMASQEIRSRPSSNALSPPPVETERLLTAPKGREDFHLLYPFGVPPGPEAAAVRIVQNVAYFWLLYTLVLWSGLSISLIPERKISLLLLVATSAVTCAYLLLLRLLPASSSMLYRIIAMRLVVMLLVVAAAIELVLTRAGIHLLATLAIGVPVIAVHAVFRTRDDLLLSEEAYNPGELFFLVGKKPREESVYYVPFSSIDQV